MMKMNKRDLIAIGRSSIDLYSQDIGVPFKEISSYGGYVYHDIIKRRHARRI